MLELSIKDYLAYCGMMSMDIYILSDMVKIPFRIILWNKMHFLHRGIPGMHNHGYWTFTAGESVYYM